jgi:3-phosphoglycerate kinase
VVAILGGAKVSDKIEVIQNLLTKADAMFVGGAMAYTLLKAQGKTVGNSLVENDKLDLAKEILSKPESKKMFLPVDHKIVQKVEAGSPVRITEDANIPDGWAGVDIGPKSQKQVEGMMAGAKTIFWNGPMGIFEMKDFSEGTFGCAKAVAEATQKGGFSVVGGGDSVAAVKQSGLDKSISHISTGGGASLEFIEGKALPGVEALPDA